ncbi:MAG: antitoxin VapB family protein [Verrucomicrobiota bacterium]
MATKTISLELDAYERLRRAKRSPRESFSEVVRRAQWDGGACGGGSEFIMRLRRLTKDRPGVLLEESVLDVMDRRAATRTERTRERG